MEDDDRGATYYRPVQRFGLLFGAAAFIAFLLLPAPESLGTEGWRTAAVAVLMAVWWMTEAIPIPGTAMLPLVLFPALGVLTPANASAPYANELIFLFMGGFLLAVTMEKWGLHKRIALSIMALVGTSPNRLVLGFMISTGFLSMWINNTATAAMLLPIAIAVGEMFRPQDRVGPYEFGICLMLGVAYSASIGGVATLIGTPATAILAGAANEILDLQIGFVQWMAVGLPIVLIMLPITWFLLTRFLYRPGALSGDAARILGEERAGLGPPSRGEKITGVVFAGTALAWVLRAEKSFGGVTIPGIATFAPGVSDSTIAMTAAVLLFLIPVDWKNGEFTLEWRTARGIPWGVLVLFGGGLSLARGMEVSGLAVWIGNSVSALEAVPTLLILGAVATLLVFLTEVTSNTATATMAMPVMAGVGLGLGIEPLLPMAAVAFGASMAFMLPVATPPNAIVFGSGYITIPQMARAGFYLNLLSILVITTLGMFLVPIFLR
ncbi:MAG TPA: DASS family sodium-coupled anion symporter [Longimicrobiales bacterium]|nr:DASS family sodium-coupled anion symporter [Longimicrobiales bacterium]